MSPLHASPVRIALWVIDVFRSCRSATMSCMARLTNVFESVASGALAVVVPPNVVRAAEVRTVEHLALEGRARAASAAEERDRHALHGLAVRVVPREDVLGPAAVDPPLGDAERALSLRRCSAREHRVWCEELRRCLTSRFLRRRRTTRHACHARGDRKCREERLGRVGEKMHRDLRSHSSAFCMPLGIRAFSREIIPDPRIGSFFYGSTQRGSTMNRIILIACARSREQRARRAMRSRSTTTRAHVRPPLRRHRSPSTKSSPAARTQRRRSRSADRARTPPRHRRQRALALDRCSSRIVR